MTSLLQRTLQRGSIGSQISFNQWVDFFSFGGLQYPFTFQQTMQGHTELADPNISFDGLILSAYKSNGIVFACMLARQKLFSEARFAYRQRRNGRPGDLFGNPDLAILENPWPGGVTGDLLARAIQDVDLAGNFFVTRRTGALRRMRPDYVTIVLGSQSDPNVQAGDIDAEVVGYIYHPGGRHSGRTPEFLLREEVAHFAPIPDPAASYRGMSWIIPIFREFQSDTAMTLHKMKFLENGATPNMVVTMDPTIKKEAFKEWVQMFSDKHEGVVNAYKTLYLGAGASVTPVGKDFRQMEFAVTQAIGETRICAAASVPPVLVGVTEGIRAATYSNYQSAKRYFADATLRPLWRNFASCMAQLVPVPAGSELWYDDRDIPFLYDDAKDASVIQASHAQSIKALVDSGYTPDSVVDAITAGDLKRLKHTGLFSVQLLPPGTVGGPPADPNAKPPDTTPTPPPEPTGKNSREEGIAILRQMAEVRRYLAPPPAPNVDVHFHEGAIRGGDTPVSVDAQTHMSDGAFRIEPHVQVDSPVTIADGAVRVDSPVTVESPTVTIAEGAIRGGDVHVDPPEFQLVDGAIRVMVDSPVTIERGAVQLDAPITVMQPELVLRDGAIHVETPVTIEKGAVQVDAPVTVERTEVPVTISEGAIRVDAPVTVERTEVHIDEGAVRVDAPVTVERTEVHIDEGAVRIDAPVTVERSEVHVDKGAVQIDAPVTVERTEVHVDDGAIRVETPVTIAEGAVRVDAPVTVQPAEVRVEPPVVTIERGAVQVDAPVTISEGAVRVDAPITMEPGAVSVQVDSPVTLERGSVQVDAPVTIERGAVEVQTDVTVPPPEPQVRRVVRETEFRTDGEGKIVGKREVETDE